MYCLSQSLSYFEFLISLYIDELLFSAIPHTGYFITDKKIAYQFTFYIKRMIYQVPIEYSWVNIWADIYRLVTSGK